MSTRQTLTLQVSPGKSTTSLSRTSTTSTIAVKSHVDCPSCTHRLLLPEPELDHVCEITLLASSTLLVVLPPHHLGYTGTMLSETIVTSIRAQQKSANTAVSKDVGIYIHSLHPTFSVQSTFKNSSTYANSLAISSTHIFAAQADKAVLHVYSRDRGNQEALISFPERIHSIVLINDALLALGTAEGRVIFWEVGHLNADLPSCADHLDLRGEASIDPDVTSPTRIKLGCDQRASHIGLRGLQHSCLVNTEYHDLFVDCYTRANPKLIKSPGYNNGFDRRQKFQSDQHLYIGQQR